MTKTKQNKENTQLCKKTHTNNWVMPPEFTFKKQTVFFAFIHKKVNSFTLSKSCIIRAGLC